PPRPGILRMSHTPPRRGRSLAAADPSRPRSPVLLPLKLKPVTAPAEPWQRARQARAKLRLIAAIVRTRTCHPLSACRPQRQYPTRSSSARPLTVHAISLTVKRGSLSVVILASSCEFC